MSDAPQPAANDYAETTDIVRYGVLGGTFDPPHLGHLLLAELARDTLGLAKVIFVPAADPPHKTQWEITPMQHRLAMLELALADNPAFVIAYADINRPGPHYTVDMLRLIRAEYASAQVQQSEFYFLLGGDSLKNFVTWRDPAGIIAQARLGVMRRPGAVIDLSEGAATLPELPNAVSFIDAPEIGISATEARERLRAGRSVRYQVPDPVVRYIQANRLYQ